MGPGATSGVPLASILTSLRSSLWFIPAVIVGAAVLLALLMVELSGTVGRDLATRWPSVFGAGADGARGMLAAIAGSMITTAGVIFSITIVVLSLASTQYTSRLLGNFMRNRVNQVVLGVFVGIFAYCLVVLRTIRGGDAEVVPTLAVFVGVLLAFVGIAYLIFFIHHIAMAIQASHILSSVARETIGVIHHRFPEEIGDGAPSVPEAPVPAPAAWHAVPAARSGYVTHIEGDDLMQAAVEAGVVVRLERVMGEFVVEGTPLLSVSAPAGTELAQRLRRRVVLSSLRTIDQDVAFGFRQLADVALKALSPGINDTTTAVMSVQWATAALAELARRHPVSPWRLDDGGALRVVAPAPTFEGLLHDTFSEIRQNAEGNVPVLRALVTGIGELAPLTRDPARRQALARELDHIIEAAERTLSTPHDRAEVTVPGTAVAGLLGDTR